MITVELTAGAHAVLPVPAGRNVFFYVVRGEVRVDAEDVAAMHLVELHDGEDVEVSAVTDALLLFGHATPYNEPVVAYGPFVMNTQQEIVQAVRDYQAGMFG